MVITAGTTNRCASSVLADAYGIHDARLKRFESGGTNETWRCDTRDKALVLKRAALPADVGWLPFQEGVLSTLVATDEPVQEPLRARTSERTVVHEDSYWQLRRFVVGEPFRQGKREQLVAAARFMASLHRMKPPRQAPPPPREFEAWWGKPDCARIELADELLPHLGERNAARLVDEIAARAAAAHLALERSGYSPFPSVVTHGEMQGTNLIYDGDRLVAVIDWDSVGIRPRTHDLARAAYLLCRRERGSFDIDDQLVQLFLETYGAITEPVAGEELAALGPIAALSLLPTASLLRAFRVDNTQRFDWYLDWSCRAAAGTSALARGAGAYAAASA